MRVDEGEHGVGEAAGEAGECGLVARGPVGEDLVEKPPSTPIDLPDDPMPLRGDRGGLDALIVGRRRTRDQAEFFEPCERAADLWVVLIEQFGERENPDGPAEIDVHEVLGQLCVDLDPGPVQEERAKVWPRGAGDDVAPDVVVVLRHPFIMHGVAATISVHYERICPGGDMREPQINAAVLHGIGQTPRYERFPAPVAGEDEVVVTVCAAALKPSDRFMAAGVHYAPTTFPQVAGLDGVGRLENGERIAFMIPERPFGGMADMTLVRRGMWLRVADDVDDVTAAAVTNPGMAAWKTLFWEGDLSAGQTVLVLGATGTSGRIAVQLAARHEARVIAAGRNQRVLDELRAAGADAAIRVDRPHAELAAAITAHGPYHLIVDYLWGPAAEAAFAALAGSDAHGEDAPQPVRYIQVGMTAGDVAALPAMTLRRAPVELVGSGHRGPAGLEAAAVAYDALLAQVAAGRITLDIEPVALADVEHAWCDGPSDRRIVFVP